MSEFTAEVTRVIQAPRDRVYRALLDPAILVQWLYPANGCVGGDAVVDERVGGRHHVEYLDEDGRRHAFDSTILELVPGERVVLDFSFVGPEPHLREDDTVLSLTLADAPGGATELRLVHERVTDGVNLNRENVTAGWGGALGHLQTLMTEGANA